MEDPVSSSPPDAKNNKSEIVTDLIVLSFIFLFIFGYFRPEYLFSRTTTTGGDTASHFYTAQYLRDYLLPRGKISGWCQGNLGGFPLLQNYFPLPFVLMAALSYVIPLAVSFKLITVLGIFLLPVSTYFFFRFLRQPYPVPIIGAIFALPFLFDQGNSMWGANIPSTLAGTFSYNLGFSLSVLWLGWMYRVFIENKGVAWAGILLALVGLCHGYTLLYCLFASLFFLTDFGRFKENLKKLILIYALSFCLMAFWLVPLLAFLPYTTRFSLEWIFFTWSQIQKEIFPIIFLPFIILSVSCTARVAMAWKTRDSVSGKLHALGLIWYLSLSGAALYGIGYRIGLVDIRFLPFFQFFLVLAGAPLLAFPKIPHAAKAVLCGIVLLSTILWVDRNETFIAHWIRSNYAGFEKARLWDSFSSVNRFLKGSPADPRVVYEHSLVNGKAGTVRAFESLPLFSGRSTLEGVYIQASLNVPFIFYTQSEISQKPSTPIAEYNYSRFDLKRAIDHLILFNVRDIILVEPESKAAAARIPELTLRHRADPFEVYQVTTNRGAYVEIVENKPVAVVSDSWRKVSYQWFRLGNLSVPLVFLNRMAEAEPHRFQTVDQLDIRNLPVSPLDASGTMKETVKEEEILIEGAPVGTPLLIKISYHPNWKVEGADRIYLSSPAFMLIYPSSARVRLHYARTWPDHIGMLLSTSAVAILFLSRFFAFSTLRRWADRWFSRWGFKIAVSAMVLVGIGFFYFILRISSEYPVLSYNRGTGLFSREDFSASRVHFKEVMDRYPQSMLVDHAGYHHAMSFFRQNDWENTIRSLQWLLENYPETKMAAEARYHIGLCHMKAGRFKEAGVEFHRTIEQFDGSTWARFAGDRLKELPPP